MKRPALGSLGLFALTAALIVTTGCGTKKKTGRLACQVDTTCPSGSLCVDNNCVTTQTCSQTSDCSGGGKCINSICWNVTCSDANPCAQGQCMEGVCVTRAGEVDASNDGTSSEDATSSDQKTGGETACSSSADCTNAFSDLGVCEQALCQDGICVRRPKLAGTSCDDGKFCTEGDECNEKGECVGQQKDCSASGDQCNAGVCDETTKSCTTVPKPDTTPCDDGSYCTINDRCDGQGQCGGDPRDCSASGDQCNSGVCDEDSKSCVKTPKSDTTPCDDGKFCTTNDTCDGQGQCLGGPIRNCAGLGNACNEGYCDLDKDSCQTRPLAKGKPCEDGKYCTINDTCDGAGTCVAGEPRNCATTNSCIAGVCDEATKQCGIPKPFGTPCKLPDTEFAMCGLFTDCRPWTSVEYQFPATGEVQLIDWARFCFSPDGKELFAVSYRLDEVFNGETTVSKTVLGLYKVDLGMLGDPIDLASDLGNFDYSFYSAVCEGGTLISTLGANNQQGDGPNRIGAYRHDGTEWKVDDSLTASLNGGPNNPDADGSNGDATVDDSDDGNDGFVSDDGNDGNSGDDGFVFDDGNDGNNGNDVDADVEPAPEFGILELGAIKKVTTSGGDQLFLAGLMGYQQLNTCTNDLCGDSRYILRCDKPTGANDYDCKPEMVGTLTDTEIWKGTNLVMLQQGGLDKLLLTSGGWNPEFFGEPTLGGWIFSARNLVDPTFTWDMGIPGCDGTKRFLADGKTPNPCYHGMMVNPLSDSDFSIYNSLGSLANAPNDTLVIAAPGLIDDIVDGPTNINGAFLPASFRYFDGTTWNMIQIPASAMPYTADELSKMLLFMGMTKVQVVAQRYIVGVGSWFSCSLTPIEGSVVCGNTIMTQPYAIVYDMQLKRFSPVVRIAKGLSCCTGIEGPCGAVPICGLIGEGQGTGSFFASNTRDFVMQADPTSQTTLLHVMRHNFRTDVPPSDGPYGGGTPSVLQFETKP